MSNTALTQQEATRAKLAWALAQTAYSMNNGGGLTVGLPLTYSDDVTGRRLDANGNVSNGWSALNLDIPSGFVVRGIYQDATTGADIFMAYNAQSRELAVGIAGTNGVGNDMPDTHADFMQVGTNQLSWLLSKSDFMDDLKLLKTESAGGFNHVYIGGQSLAGGPARLLGYALSGTDGAIVDPENMTVSAINPLGVETAAHIMGYDFESVRAWANQSNVYNYMTFNANGSSDLVSILGGRGVGRNFALDVYSDENSSIGGLHPFNFGIAEAFALLDGDLTQARAIDEQQK